MRKTLPELLTYDNLKIAYRNLGESTINAGMIWTLGKAANVISEKIAHFPLNYFNSIDHLTIGTGLGTFAYLIFGEGRKGTRAALIATTAFNVLWEVAEAKGQIYGNGWNLIDTATDVACVYAGLAIGVLLIEKGKDKLKAYIKKKDAYSKKWVI